MLGSVHCHNKKIISKLHASLVIKQFGSHVTKMQQNYFKDFT